MQDCYQRKGCPLSKLRDQFKRGLSLKFQVIAVLAADALISTKITNFYLNLHTSILVQLKFVCKDKKFCLTLKNISKKRLVFILCPSVHFQGKCKESFFEWVIEPKKSSRPQTGFTFDLPIWISDSQVQLSSLNVKSCFLSCAILPLGDEISAMTNRWLTKIDLLRERQRRSCSLLIGQLSFFFLTLVMSLGQAVSLCHLKICSLCIFAEHSKDLMNKGVLSWNLAVGNKTCMKKVQQVAGSPDRVEKQLLVFHWSSVLT